MAVQFAPEDTRQKVLHDDWRWNWKHQVENAKSRPAMSIGNLETAHLSAVSMPLALVRKARAFRAPKFCTVHLSPNKYVVRCEAGRLLPAIEDLHTWNGKHILAAGWNLDLDRLRQERHNRFLDERPDFVGWKKYFSGTAGPTLEQPIYPAVLARSFAFAYKTSIGFRGQVFEEGKQPDDPFLLKEDSPVGLLILAELDPRWFTGLPFTPDDVQRLAGLPDVSAVWHDEDADLNVEVKSAGDIGRWL